MNMSGMSNSSSSSSSASAASPSNSMDSSSSDSMSTMMTLVFTNSQITPLYSPSWTPSSTGAYAGTCIFLIVLAILGRVITALRAEMQRRVLATTLNRRYVVVAGKPSEVQRIEASPDTKIATLVTANGVEESVRIVQRMTQSAQPWRFTVDLPRALVYLCIAGVGYLLMLAVMTMNVGYFCSVLTGAFLGELAVGRYILQDGH